MITAFPVTHSNMEQARDLQDMLGISHSLHRRRICLGIQKIKEKEYEEVLFDAADFHRRRLFSLSETCCLYNAIKGFLAS